MNWKKQIQICPVGLAGMVDSKLRKLAHNPQEILKSFIKEGMIVLDVGCGPGFFSVEIAKMLNGIGKVIAADVQEGMLDKIRKKISGTPLEQSIELHKSDYENIGVTEKVDFVLAFYMVHEVGDQTDQKRFFNELSSILKPNGLILIVEPKLHVSKKKFDKMVNMLKDSEFSFLESPKIFLSRTVVITKNE